MCQFLSAVVLRNGDVLTHPMLDSHTDLVTYYKLPDTLAHHQHFAKVELVPVDWTDAATWTFTLDKETAPSWWDDVKASVEETMRRRARAMILLSGVHRLIVDGCWIVGRTAQVIDVRAGRIIHVSGSAQMSNVGGTARVFNVGDSARVFNVGGSVRVFDVSDTAFLDASARAHLVISSPKNP